jgi:hypothetical protein
VRGGRCRTDPTARTDPSHDVRPPMHLTRSRDLRLVHLRWSGSSRSDGPMLTLIDQGSATGRRDDSAAEPAPGVPSGPCLTRDAGGDTARTICWVPDRWTAGPTPRLTASSDDTAASGLLTLPASWRRHLAERQPTSEDRRGHPALERCCVVRPEPGTPTDPTTVDERVAEVTC